MKRITWLVLAIGLITISASADVLTLKNGEQLIGSWITVKDGNLAFKSDTLGETTIPLSKVKSFSSTTPAVVVKKDNSTARGQLELMPTGDWQVTKGGQSQIVPASSIAVIMPQATFTSLVEHHAAAWQDWKGAANFGYNLQRGDQQTSTISAIVGATRERPEAPIFMRHWRTNYSLLMLFSKAKQNALEIRSDTITTSLRQDYLITPRDFLFGLGELDHIQAQGIYLRQTYGGGYGHDFIHTSRTVFSGLGGLTFVNTKFYTGGPAKQSAEALLGEKLSTALTKRIALTHDFNFYPNLSDTGEYRFDTTTGLSIRLASRFSANVGFVDLYLSSVPPGNHKNNVALTTGLGVTF
ncbi:MAG: DUF481 domain-containing protein [Terriglobia bacterium]